MPDVNSTSTYLCRLTHTEWQILCLLREINATVPPDAPNRDERIERLHRSIMLSMRLRQIRLSGAPEVV